MYASQFEPSIDLEKIYVHLLHILIKTQNLKTASLHTEISVEIEEGTCSTTIINQNNQ